MNRARSFFYVCLGLLCIGGAYHFGAQNARAQAGSGVDLLPDAGTLAVSI
jgi:hypothetical protein